MLWHQPKLKDKMLPRDPNQCNTDLPGIGVTSNACKDIFIFQVLGTERYFFHGLFNDFSRKVPGLI